MQLISAASLLVSAAAAASIARSQAQCACGYQDPSTLALFTDSVITYFNETGAAEQIVFVPEESADRYGRDSAGYAGVGQEAWINSQRTNEWEDDFSATWRSAVSYNNTFLANNSMNMMVAQADTKNRIVYGSQFQTRRRDILYGTFRFMVMPPTNWNAGTEFDIELAYNASSVVQTSFFSKDNTSDATLEMGFSSKKNALKPVVIEQANFSTGHPSWHEYRMDWLPNSLSWSSDAGSDLSVVRPRDKNTQIPVLPAPFSFKHWSNGSPTGSKGPPVHHAPLARIAYARLFFNSSIAERSRQFGEHCAAAGGGEVCSTDDWTLRNSTQVVEAMTVNQRLPHRPYHARQYAWIGFTVSIGIFSVLFVHASARRIMKAYAKRQSFYDDYNSRQKETQDAVGATDTAGTAPPRSKSVRASDYTDSELADMADQKVFDEAMATWDNPEFLIDDAEDREDASSDVDAKDEVIVDDPFYQQHVSAGSQTSLAQSLKSGYRLPSVRFVAGTPDAGTGWTPSASTTDLAARIRNGISTPTGTGTPTGSMTPTTFRINSQLPSSSSPALHTSESIASSFAPRLYQRPTSSLGDHESSIYDPSLVTGEDGLGAPPAMPDLVSFHPHPEMLLENGLSVPVHWSTPIAEWKPAAPNQQSDAQGRLAKAPGAVAADQKSGQPTTDAKETFWERIKYKVFMHKGEGGATASGAARVEYLDGLRGFACLLVSLHHWLLIFYYGITTHGAVHHYGFEPWIYRILGPVICNGGLNVGIFFVLAARVIANRYLVRGNLQDLAQQIFTRVPRLATTITAALFICYFLIEAGAFYWVSKLPSRTYSVWSYYQDYSSAGEFINDYLTLWFMQPPSITPFITHYATGILWTVPVIVQSSWTVYICALIAREIKKPWKRYGFYLTVLTLEWWSNRYDYFFIGGLMIADLDNRLKYRQLSAQGFKVMGKVKMTYEPLAWMLFFLGAVITWITQQRVFDARTGEFGIKADFQLGQPNKWGNVPKQYNLPSVQDAIWVFSFFLLCDLSDFVRTVFTLRLWSVFGRNAFSLYLLHGTVFWTVGAAATLHMLAAGIPYWAAMILNFFLCYTVLFVACEIFTRTFDRWGIMVARAFWRAASGGLGRRIR